MARRRGCAGRIMALALVAAALLCGYMALMARVVRVESAEVYLDDLPAEFDGVKVLFLTDLHVGAYGGAEETAELINALQSLYPDILLLGGDYVGADPFTAADRQGALSGRDAFFTSIGWFYAPLGKYGVRGNHDSDAGLSASMALGGVTLLNGQTVRLERNGAYLYLAGLDDWKTGSQQIGPLAAAVSRQDAVLALSHNPDAFPAALREGPWFDLMLSGHTHGGQVNFPGLNRLLSPSIYADHYMSGWVREQGTLLLVSNGVGCTALPFRLNAPAQAHLLTLRRN